MAGGTGGPHGVHAAAISCSLCSTDAQHAHRCRSISGSGVRREKKFASESWQHCCTAGWGEAFAFGYGYGSPSVNAPSVSVMQSAGPVLFVAGVGAVDVVDLVHATATAPSATACAARNAARRVSGFILPTVAPAATRAERVDSSCARE